MSTEIVAADRTTAPLLVRARRFVLGPPLPARLPGRVESAIREEQDGSEILVSLMQLAAVTTFAVLYGLSPKGFPPGVPFEPVPVTLAVYAGFTLIRLWLAWQRRLTPWFIALSVVVDITVLMVTIWSFYLQYRAAAGHVPEGADPDVRLHPDRAAHASLRALAGHARRGVRLARLALSRGLRRAGGGQDAELTHSFATYAMSNQILLGAEFDKVVSLLMVTLILAIALLRARKLLFRAVADQLAAAELSRFFAPEVAGRIRDQRHRARARAGGAARGGDPDGRSARLHAAHPGPGAARGDGAAVRIPVAGGRGGQRARRQHRQVHGRRRSGQLRRDRAEPEVRGRRAARRR